jgi:large subunit ribosomal protein L20
MKRARVFKLAKGFYGRSKNCFRIAVNRVEKALAYAYRGRKLKKRNFRRLWILQTSAACRLHGMCYSQFIYGLQKENIKLNRKMLASLAVTEPYSFWALVEHVKKGYRFVFLCIKFSCALCMTRSVCLCFFVFVCLCDEIFFL